MDDRSYINLTNKTDLDYEYAFENPDIGIVCSSITTKIYDLRSIDQLTNHMYIKRQGNESRDLSET